MLDSIYNLLDSLHLENPQQYDTLVIFPITGKPPSKRTYLSLSEAMASGTIKVKEVSKGGSVPELLVKNKGDMPVLMLDGEELSGAKQNRILNATILVDAKSRLVVPVSCTERGRWAYQTPTFGDSGEIATTQVRQRKTLSVTENLQAADSYRSDQGSVWSEIHDLEERTQVRSPSSAMRDVYEARRKRMTVQMDAFPRHENQCGLAVVVSNELRGLDWVSDPQAYVHLHEKLVRSYLVDLPDRAAAESPSHGNEAFDKFATMRLHDVLKDLKSAQETVHESPGLGQDHRLQAQYTFGSALVWENGVVHLVAFPSETQAPERPRHGIAGWRARRRNRNA